MKKVIQSGLFVLLMLFAFSGISKAETLLIPPLEIDFAGSQDASLICIITNVSQTARSMTIDVININCVAINMVTDMVDPGTRLGITQGSDNRNSTPSHCKFTVVNGNKSSVRASAYIFHVGIGCISGVTAF
jgi:hypothetical protein